MSKRLNNIIMRRKSETAYNSAGSKDASSVPDAMDMARNGHPNDSWFKVADSGGSTSEDHREMTRPISKGHLPNGQGNINASDPNRSLNPATSSLPDIGSQDFETKPVAECVKSGSLSGMIQPEEMGARRISPLFFEKRPHKGKDGISPDISPPQFTVPIHSEPNKSKAIWEGDVKEQALQKAAPPIPVSRDMELLKKRSHDHRVRDTEKAIIAKTGDKGADRLHPLSGLFLQASHVRRLAAKIWDQLISWVTFDRHTFRERTDITALSTPQYMDGVIQVEGGPLNTIDIRGPAATILRYFKTARIRNVLTFSIILLALSFLLPRPEAWSQALGDHKRVQYTGAAADHFASQSIAPLALGGDSGNRMSATEHVIALAVSPERPSLTMQAILGRTENVEEMLRRVGVQNNEAELLFSKIANIFDEGSDKTGTKFEILLGRRPEAKSRAPWSM